MKQIYRSPHNATAPWLPQEYMLESEAEISALPVLGVPAGSVAYTVNNSVRLVMSADELIRQDRPAVIWWRYGHWCVFCGQDDQGRVVICNPDRGRYGIDPGSFASLYSGVALFNGEPEPLPEA